MKNMLSGLLLNVAFDCALATIPVLLAYAIVWIANKNISTIKRAIIITPLFIVWLIFLPNTCYLLTEWRHFLGYVDSHNLWILADTYHSRQALVTFGVFGLFYFLFSGYGMITFTLAIRPMEHLAKSRGVTTWLWTLPFFVALSLGVYLGLKPRFNSWNFIDKPGEIWATVVEIGGRPYLSAFIVMFGGFLWIAYEALDIWVDGLVARWQRFKLDRRAVN